MKKRLMILGLGGMFLTMSSLAFAEGVFVTKKGKKYHSEICRSLKKKNPVALELEIALDKGYKPCKRCFSDKTKSVEVKK